MQTSYLFSLYLSPFPAFLNFKFLEGRISTLGDAKLFKNINMLSIKSNSTGLAVSCTTKNK